MKQVNIFKSLLLAGLLGTAGSMSAQTIVHPNAFGVVTTGFPSNWYKDYVGVRIEVNAPSVIAGEKVADAAEVGTGTSQWPSIVYNPVINTQAVMPLPADSCGCAAITGVSMTGKIALLWRGPQASPCDFTQKAINAQNAGAIAVVIINEYAGQAPFVPGFSTGFATVTIPVVMIGNLDGIAIAAQYAADPTSVYMTISPWGYDYGNDLGFVQSGASRWLNYATPRNQVISSGDPFAYQALDGAYVANFGTNPSYNVTLNTNVTFTASGSSTPSTIHTSSIVLDTFNVADSIFAMYTPTYDLSGITGNGKVTVNYSLTSDSTDAFPSNDTTSTSFYLTDSVYSKGVYDFANNRPLAALYEAAAFGTTGNTEFIWGNMYYVNKAGSAASSVQWSMSALSDTVGVFTGLPSGINVYIFKWNDGSNGSNLDSFVETSELELIGLGIKTMGAAGDTSGGYFNVSIFDSVGLGGQQLLDANSWYYVACEIPNNYYMGCDGVTNTLPRSFGRWENGVVEYGSPVWAAGYDNGDPDALSTTANQLVSPSPFGGNYKIDSVIYSSQKGLVPSVAMIVNNSPVPDTTTTISHVGVKNVSGAFAKFDLYPNPTTDNINASISLNNSANVTYTIIDGSARVVSKVTHNNVSSEVYTYATDKLPAGNYSMVVTAAGKAMFKKFTVLKH